jgi:hypothetical protein
MCFYIPGSNSDNSIHPSLTASTEVFSKSPINKVSSNAKIGTKPRGRSLSSPFVTEYFKNQITGKTNEISNLNRLNPPGDVSSFHEEFDEKLIMNYKNEIDDNSNYTMKIQKNLFDFSRKNRTIFLERVSKGSPQCFRWSSWKICVNISNEVKEEIFNFFAEKSLNENVDIQIRKDLNRTLSNEPVFNHSESQIYLYRILRAFANVDQGVNYCQGMNFIAGFLLIVSDFNEMETFFMLLSLFSADTFNKDYYNVCNYGIRGFFFDDFLLLKFYLNLFDYFFTKKLPLLKTHFANIEMPNEVWISKWFQTMFTICMPLHAVVRLWDCILSQGIIFMVKFTLAFLKSREEEILKLDEAFDIVDFFKLNFYKHNFDVEEVIQNAKKIDIDKSSITAVKKEFEEINKINLNRLKIKYDLTVSDNLSIVTAIQEINLLSGSNQTNKSPYYYTEPESEASSICSFFGEFSNVKEEEKDSEKNVSSLESVTHHKSNFHKSINGTTSVNPNHTIPLIYINSFENFSDVDNTYCRGFALEGNSINGIYDEPSVCYEMDTSEFTAHHNINHKVNSHTLHDKYIGLCRLNSHTSFKND